MKYLQYLKQTKLQSLLGDTAKLTFNDADGNVILDGATDIKNASYQYGKTSQTGSAQSYVQVEFNAEAKQKFADATKAAAARSSEGKNYISIQMDGKRYFFSESFRRNQF